MSYTDTMLLGIAGILLVWCLYQYLDNLFGVEISKVAKKLRLTFVRKYQVDVDKTFSDFKLFSLGVNKKVEKIMYGTYNNYKIRLFEYSYKRTHKRLRSNSQTVILIQFENFRLPEFQLCPERNFQQIGAPDGYEVVNFEQSPVFWSVYLLRALDEKAIRKMFSQEVLHYFSSNKGLCIECSGRRMIYYKLNTVIEVSKTRAFMDKAIHTLNLIKKTYQEERIEPEEEYTPLFLPDQDE